METVKKFYDAQKQRRSDSSNEDEKKVASWLDETTIDAWRHNRMLSFVDPLLKVFSGARWLTIGDGRYGFETRYLLKKDHSCDITTSDLDDTLLRKALEVGLIKKYSVENCESLSFADDNFDFVICKESYHHFPRPYAALYEMLRVASRAVILIEPSDLTLSFDYREKINQIQEGSISFRDITRAILRKIGILGALRKLRGISKTSESTEIETEFEPSGNFIYSISKREMEKVALGLGLPAVAFASLNDYYEAGVEFEKASSDSVLFRKVQTKIAEADADSTGNILCAILFLLKPDKHLRQELQQAGFVLKEMPRNPYLP